MTVLTTLIAFIGVTIAFWQWRTAHQKVVLDVFDRRINIYNRIREVIDKLLKGSGFSPEEHREMLNVKAEAKFLFGNEVNSYIEHLIEEMWEIRNDKHSIKNLDDPEMKMKIALALPARIASLQDFHNDFPPLCEPYMKMDHKLIRPLVWLRTVLKNFRSSVT